MLLERPGELVTREEICQKLWPADTFVDFDHSLGTAINKIREVLNDSVAEPRFVETLPRRGYRFIAPVTAVPVDPPLTPVETVSLPLEIRKPPRRRRSMAIAGGGAVLLIIFGFVAWSYFERSHRSSPEAARLPQVKSIAVLPLLNLSSDPAEQFLVDGITDELITNLAQIGSLRVISHTSAMAYVGTHKSAPEIAHELGVDALVEGSVVRSGNKLRITTQLIHAASDRHLWAHTYDLELGDVLTVQGEVARDISASISQTLTPQEQARLSSPHPMNPEVADLYFKGSYYLNKLDLDRAKEMFSAATQLDPNSAESWAGLADTFHHKAANGGGDGDFVRARDAANRALKINPSQAQALMVLGIASFAEWKPAESEAFFRRSIEARPGYAMARMLFAVTLAHYGRYDEAVQQAKLASALDPVSVLTNSMAWHAYFCARHYDEALRIILAAIDVDPGFGPAHFRLGISWEQKGEYQKAIEENPARRSELSAALASGGPRGYWKRKLEILLRDRKPDARGGFAPIARCYMHLGMREDALKTLEKGYEMRDSRLMLWVPAFEEFDPLRSDPRFQKILHGVGIP